MTRSCKNCNSFSSPAADGYSHCRTFEAYKGYATIERCYIRPECTEKQPCPYWTEIPKEPSVEPYKQPSYDNAIIFQKKQLKRRRKVN